MKKFLPLIIILVAIAGVWYFVLRNKGANYNAGGMKLSDWAIQYGYSIEQAKEMYNKGQLQNVILDI